jgi:23S rRNA pseudouridine1911/1915/1917 synthase
MQTASKDSMAPSSPVTLHAPAAPSGERLDKWLSGQIEGLSRSRLRILIEEGRLRQNGAILLDASGRVLPGAVYDLDIPPPAPADPLPEDIPISVIYEDRDVIVVDKPAGMVVHPAAGSWTGTLVNALLHHCGRELTGIGGVMRPGVVHRLDKDTSGVLVVAKSQLAHARLTDMFAAHDIERVYIALTAGAPRPLTGRIETFIGRSPHDRKKMAVMKEKAYRADPFSDDPDLAGDETPSGKPAITNYRTLSAYGRQDAAGALPAAARVECRLETGRTHQIRVHMQHIGCPVLGDRTYSRRSWLKVDGAGAAVEAAKAAVRTFPRQALHAAHLGFVHPISGQTLAFSSPIPEDMAALEAALSAL